MILKREVIERLSKKLSLSFTGIEQDWELEMANSERINDFLNFYKRNYLSIDEKLVIMSLILASYDDFLNKNDLEVDDRWNEIKEALVLERIVFNELIDYWALDNEVGEENLFRITPLMRSIKLY